MLFRLAASSLTRQAKLVTVHFVKQLSMCCNVIIAGGVCLLTYLLILGVNCLGLDLKRQTQAAWSLDAVYDRSSPEDSRPAAPQRPADSRTK